MTNKVKVLTNDVQSHLEGKWIKFKFGKDYDPDSDKLLDPIIGWSTKRFDPIYNRVGLYKTKDLTWREFKLPSGRMIATECDSDMFDYRLERLTAKENPIGEEEWLMIAHLLKKGVIKADKRISFERDRRRDRKFEIDTKRRLKDLRIRIQNKIEEKKGGK